MLCDLLCLLLCGRVFLCLHLRFLCVCVGLLALVVFRGRVCGYVFICLPRLNMRLKNQSLLKMIVKTLRVLARTQGYTSNAGLNLANFVLYLSL